MALKVSAGPLVLGKGGGLQIRAAAAASNPFPTITGAVNRWRASSIVGNDGDAIASISDLIGSTTITQATAGKKPTLKKNILNGKAVIRHDGGDCLTNASYAAVSGASAVEIFIVTTNLTAGTDSVLIEMSPDYNSNAGCFIFYLASGGSLFLGSKGNTGLTTFDTTPHPTSGTFDGQIDYSLATAEASTKINGSAAAGTRANNLNNTGTFTTGTSLNIGARNNAASLGVTGDWAEIVICNQILSGADRTLLEAYFRTEYAQW